MRSHLAHCPRAGPVAKWTLLVCVTQNRIICVVLSCLLLHFRSCLDLHPEIAKCTNTLWSGTRLVITMLHRERR